MSAPPSNRWVAYECRSVCGDTSAVMPAFSATDPQHRPGALPREPTTSGVDEQRRSSPPRSGETRAARAPGTHPAPHARTSRPEQHVPCRPCRAPAVPVLARRPACRTSRLTSSTSSTTASEIRHAGPVEQLQQRGVTDAEFAVGRRDRKHSLNLLPGSMPWGDVWAASAAG